MTADALRAALKTAFDSDDAASAMAGGDFSVLSDADLTDDEREMVQAAAAEIADNDVSGFAHQLSAGLEPNAITLDNGIEQAITLDNGIKFMPNVRRSLDYYIITMEN